ncbi:unnamed protein product [[Candida] boidinii]|nr:unnamed protein product [[Candida] boidinii]
MESVEFRDADSIQPELNVPEDQEEKKIVLQDQDQDQEEIHINDYADTNGKQQSRGKLPGTEDSIYFTNEDDELEQVQGKGQGKEEFENMEPVKVRFSDGSTKFIGGTSYDTLEDEDEYEDEDEIILIDQLSTSSIKYQFKFENPVTNETKIVELSSQQCIIVDNGIDQPYLLINKSGKKLLNKLDKLGFLIIYMNNSQQPSNGITNISTNETTQIANANNEININDGNNGNSIINFLSLIIKGLRK